MKKSNLLKSALSLSLIACAIGSGTVNATPTITDWGVVVSSGFLDNTYNLPNGDVISGAWTQNAGTGSGVVGSDVNPTFSWLNGMGLPSTLRWADTNGNASSISVSGGSTPPGVWNGTIYTNQAPQQTVEFKHSNFPIGLGAATLSKATLFDTISLTGLAPAYANAFAPIWPIQAALTFKINFFETPNQGSCSSTATSAGCNDIFVLDITGTNLTIDALDFSLNQKIVLTPYDVYNVKLGLQGFGPLTDSECLAAGSTTGCIGFTTEEGKVNTRYASLSIQRIPEPSVIALLGVGLFGLSLTRRRKV